MNTPQRKIQPQSREGYAAELVGVLRVLDHLKHGRAGSAETRAAAAAPAEASLVLLLNRAKYEIDPDTFELTDLVPLKPVPEPEKLKLAQSDEAKKAEADKKAEALHAERNKAMAEQAHQHLPVTDETDELKNEKVQAPVSPVVPKPAPLIVAVPPAPPVAVKPVVPPQAPSPSET